MNRKFVAIVALFIALISGSLADSARASTITLVWDPSPSATVAGYAVYYGNMSGEHPNRIDAGNQTNLTFQAADDAASFFVVTAYTSDGLESLPSNEVVYRPVIAPAEISAGNFSGLLNINDQSQGYFTLKKRQSGTFSGTIELDGRKYRFSGKADSSGIINVVIPRRGETSLLLSFNADSSNSDRLTGTLTDDDWLMSLNADRLTFNAKTNAAPYVGKYTVVIAGILGEELVPGGIGFAAVNVLPNGKVKARGTLGDGKNFANTTYLSSEGAWPFYVPAYGRKTGGSISGWLQFKTNGTDSVHGDLTWIRPTIPKSKLYPDGFTNSVALVGSIYVPPAKATNAVIAFTNGTFTVSGADLQAGYVKDIMVSGTKVAPLIKGEDKLAIKIKKQTGLFSGKIRVPDFPTPLKFRGALLQNQNVGYGLFFRTNQTGEVSLEASP